MLKTLYVSDLDGTLLGEDSRVSERSRRIISNLSRRGALITVATARTPATVQPLLEGMETSIPAITMTGAAMWDRQRQCFDHVRLMDRADVLTALEVCDACGIHPFVYTLDGNRLEVFHAAGELNRAEQCFYDLRANLPLKRFHLRTSVPDEALGRTVLLCTLGSMSGTDTAAGELTRRTDCAAQSYPDIMLADTGILEVFAPGVSKAAAIRRMRENTGATRVVAFGDNLNDLPMLAEADVAVAVGNALPEVRAAADIVIGPNTADAVARFISEDYALSTTPRQQEPRRG